MYIHQVIEIKVLRYALSFYNVIYIRGTIVSVTFKQYNYYEIHACEMISLLLFATNVKAT